MIYIDCSEKHNRRLPKIGEVLPAFDDGKCRPSRLYFVKVIDVLPWGKKALEKEFESINFKNNNLVDEVEFGKYPLKNAWEYSYKDTDWIFDNKTDYFIVTETDSKYEPIEIFARQKNGGWFSIPLKSYMTGSLLDSDLKIFNSWKTDEYFSNDYAENCSKVVFNE